MLIWVSKVDGIYIAALDMVIKPIWDENKFKYFDLVTWNAAIEKAVAEIKNSNGPAWLEVNIRRLKK